MAFASHSRTHTLSPSRAPPFLTHSARFQFLLIHFRRENKAICWSPPIRRVRSDSCKFSLRKMFICTNCRKRCRVTRAVAALSTRSGPSPSIWEFIFISNVYCYCGIGIRLRGAHGRASERAKRWNIGFRGKCEEEEAAAAADEGKLARIETEPSNNWN